ncbi:MAG: helix-turn-helix domain-containing protein, partial [Actinobacteria bacterium]|nr:helix-turn-helix domain-containing protein [Actinomycetota bacterium]
MELLEVDAGGVVLLWGRAAWCWDAGDVVGRRLAAVQLVDTRSARHGEVMAAFGIADVTLRAWRHAYADGGVEALSPRQRGPRGPSRLTEAKVAEIAGARAQGASMDAIAAATG